MGKDTAEASFVILHYTLIHLKTSDKIRFYYSLKGRDGKSGILKLYRVEQLGKGVLWVSLPYASDVEDFLRFWKCAYQKKEVTLRA